MKLRLSEHVTFLHKAAILDTLKRIPNDEQVIIDASRTKNIHPDVIEIIEDFQENAKTRNIGVELAGFDNNLSVSNPVRQLDNLVLKKTK